jgi:hypothetical protein
VEVNISAPLEIPNHTASLLEKAKHIHEQTPKASEVSAQNNQEDYLDKAFIRLETE